MEEGSGGERGEKERESKRQRQRDRDQDLKAIAEAHLFVFVSLVAEGSWQLRDAVWSLHFSENAGNPDAKEFLCYEVSAAMGNHVL